MNTKWKKGLVWIMAAILLLVAIQSLTGIFGGHGGHAMHPIHPSINPGYDYGQLKFMRGHHGMGGHHGAGGGHHAMGGFHFIGSAVSLVFWLAAIVVLFSWLRKKRKARSFNHLVMDAPISYQTYTTNQNQPDFLDEWEKKQTTHKEEK